MRPDSVIIPHLVAQHAEEAADLWVLRDRCVNEPHFTLRDLVRLDERVEAHVDGLRIAGADAAGICDEVLPGDTAGQVFARALWTFAAGDAAQVQAVFESALASRKRARGVTSALGWLSYGEAELQIRSLLDAETPVARRIGVAAAAAHRRIDDRALRRALEDADPLLRSRALRAIGELGMIDLLPAARAELAAEDAGCRFWAAWSAALLSPAPEPLSLLMSEAASGDAGRSALAFQLVLRRLDPYFAAQWLKTFREKRDARRLAVIGVGIVGDSEAAPWLLDTMAAPALARVAGEAFTMITGLDLHRDNMKGEKPEGFDAGPTEDPEDESVDADPDDNFYWPDRQKIAAWWAKHQDEFVPGVRRLLGKPLSADWLEDVLRMGRQSQRTGAALELSIQQPSMPLFNVRAPAPRQKRQLGVKKG